MEDADQRRNIVSKFQESIQAANSFLTGIDGIIAKALENLYVVEYAMQMFSYYTINVEDGHTRPAEDIISLSGYSLQDRPDIGENVSTFCGEMMNLRQMYEIR